jgi:hypothetical protein
MAMNDDMFERRVRSAAVAGWWVVLFGVVLITLAWLALRTMMSAQPEWLLSLWGPDITWSYVENVTLWAIVAFKLALFLLAMTALWLTLWARGLRKSA